MGQEDRIVDDKPLYDEVDIEQRISARRDDTYNFRDVRNYMLRLSFDYELELQRLRAQLAALEQAPALERVPDGEYFNGALIVRGRDIGLIVDASLDHHQWLSDLVEGGLPEGWVLMRPASTRGQEDTNE